MAVTDAGPLVFFKKVRRAATKAQPHLRPGLRVARSILRRITPRLIAAAASGGPLAVEAALDVAVRTAAFAALQSTQRKVPVATGRLRSSYTVAKRSQFVYSVGTNVFYARFVELGTKGGQIIRPRTKKALRFRWRNAPAGLRKPRRSR